MFKYGDEIKLQNDVFIKIMGVFPPEQIYLVDINGIKKRMDDELLRFFISKFEHSQLDEFDEKDGEVSEAINNEIKTEEEKLKKTKKGVKNGRTKN